MKLVSFVNHWIRENSIFFIEVSNLVNLSLFQNAILFKFLLEFESFLVFV